jgi:hypothetical protein
MIAANSFGSQLKRFWFALLMVMAIVFAMFVWDTTTSAEPANAATSNNRVCTRVTVPKTLPWYRCVNLLTMPAGSLPSGCYTTTKIVCKG